MLISLPVSKDDYYLVRDHSRVCKKGENDDNEEDDSIRRKHVRQGRACPENTTPDW